MLHFICMFQLLHGPLADGPDAVMAPASQLFARIERARSIPVERAEPDLDNTAIRFRERAIAGADDLALVLVTYGIYLHPTENDAGAPVLRATRDPAPPARKPPHVFLKVYAPVHVQPEELLERLAAAAPGRAVSARLEERTGKIVLRAPNEAALAAASEFLARLDTPREGSARFHAFRCRKVPARDAEAELLRLMPRDVRARVTVVSYEKINTLMVSADPAEWEMIAGMLAKIDPEGESL